MPINFSDPGFIASLIDSLIDAAVEVFKRITGETDEAKIQQYRDQIRIEMQKKAEDLAKRYQAVAERLGI